jgi:hypothetical protein
VGDGDHSSDLGTDSGSEIRLGVVLRFSPRFGSDHGTATPVVRLVIWLGFIDFIP